MATLKHPIENITDEDLCREIMEMMGFRADLSITSDAPRVKYFESECPDREYAIKVDDGMGWRDIEIPPPFKLDGWVGLRAETDSLSRMMKLFHSGSLEVTEWSAGDCIETICTIHPDGSSQVQQREFNSDHEPIDELEDIRPSNEWCDYMNDMLQRSAAVFPHVWRALKL